MRSNSRLSQRTEKGARLGVERTARIHRWSFDHGRIYPASMGSVQAEECARDRPAVHSIFHCGYRVLAVLWNFNGAAVTNRMERENLCPRMGHVMCQAKTWQIVPVTIGLSPPTRPQPFAGLAHRKDSLPNSQRSCRNLQCGYAGNPAARRGSSISCYPLE